MWSQVYFADSVALLNKPPLHNRHAASYLETRHVVPEKLVQN